MTQSVATTGVSSMTGPLLASAGGLTAPGLSFASAPATGFYLASSNVIGVANNGIQTMTFNADGSTTWNGFTTFDGTLAINGAGVTFSSGTSIGFDGTSYIFGAGAANALVDALALNAAIEFFIDGGGSVISTGVRGYIEVPFNCTVITWTVVSDQNGLVCDVWRANGSLPTSSAQSIVGGGTKPQSSGGTYAQNAPSGWTSTTLAKGDVLVYDVTSSSSITKCLISLDVTRTAA